MEDWRVIPYRIFDGYENMALDEAVFRVMTRQGGPPTLRLFGWSRPTLTIGYSQKLDREINVAYCEKRGIDIVRRPTGGKAVFHSTDLTYSISAPQDYPPFSADILATYRIVSECIIGGLAKVGIQATLVESGRSPGRGARGGSCFAVPFSNELLVDGAKICGSAQLRGQGCFLQHGSILIDDDPEPMARATSMDEEGQQESIARLSDRITSVGRVLSLRIDAEGLAPFVTRGFEEALGISLKAGETTEAEEAEKGVLLDEKYRNPRWNREGGL